MQKETVGCIGQGWIGKHYADELESRGISVVRYALEEPYVQNKESIATCSIVFIAVPTPTPPRGFDSSYVTSVLSLVGKGNIAVIKSTVVPGTTDALQAMFPDIVITHAPEFLRESHAAHDVAHPERTLIGIPDAHKDDGDIIAKRIMSVLPKAPHEQIMPAKSAELVKYAGNVFLALKVVYANMLYDTATALSIPYEDVRDALAHDSRIGASHLSPIDTSGHATTPGRGAGGHCFIKDLEAFTRVYEHESGDQLGTAFLRAAIEKNNALLRESNKDIDLLEEVYGKN